MCTLHNKPLVQFKKKPTCLKKVVPVYYILITDYRIALDSLLGYSDSNVARPKSFNLLAVSDDMIASLLGLQTTRLFNHGIHRVYTTWQNERVRLFGSFINLPDYTLTIGASLWAA